VDRSSPPPADRHWHIVARWQEYEGEARANLLRIAAIGCFYAVELLDYHGLKLGNFTFPSIVDRKFHELVTGLALAWALTALAVLVLQKNRIFPAALKYGTTAADLFFLTWVLVLADGPKSPLVVGYFLIIVLAALRFSLWLVRFAAVGAVAGYLFILGQGKWFSEPPRTVPRHDQLIMVIALALTGVILGQIVRRAARMAEDYAARRATEKNAAENAP
jgi:hypothetical protein